MIAVPIAGEGSWYRPKQAMRIEPSGAGLAWRADRVGRRVTEGSKTRGGRKPDSRGRRGRDVQTGLFQDLSESLTAPSGRL